MLHVRSCRLGSIRANGSSPIFWIRENTMRIPLGLMAVAMAGVLHAQVSLAQAQAPAGSADAAKGKVSMCIGCHGIPAYKTAYPEVYSVPMIAGQPPQYIVKALQA